MPRTGNGTRAVARGEGSSSQVSGILGCRCCWGLGCTAPSSAQAVQPGRAPEASRVGVPVNSVYMHVAFSSAESAVPICTVAVHSAWARGVNTGTAGVSLPVVCGKDARAAADAVIRSRPGRVVSLFRPGAFPRPVQARGRLLGNSPASWGRAAWCREGRAWSSGIGDGRVQGWGRPAVPVRGRWGQPAMICAGA